MTGMAFQLATYKGPQSPIGLIDHQVPVSSCFPRPVKDDTDIDFQLW